MTVNIYIDFDSRKFGIGVFHEKKTLASEFKHHLFIHLLWFELGFKFVKQ